MCAILDKNVVHEVFGENRPSAGVEFFEWLNSGKGLLVLGGKLRQELVENRKFKEWLPEAVRAGRIRTYNDETVNGKTNEPNLTQSCKSNDRHIVALAQISGARLLYSNDDNLRRDFKHKALIDKPRGKIYSTRQSKNFQPSHARLLNDSNLCKRVESTQ